MAIVYLGIGSNLGNRAQNIAKAVHYLEEADIKVLQRSHIMESDPVGGPVQGKFFNAAIKIETDLSPLALLKKINEIEHKLHRIRTVMDGPRTIDLDILLYDEIVLESPDLTIPHPRMWQRNFVMTPLKEIAPDIIEKFSHAHI